MSVETYRENGHLKFENDHGGLYELSDDDHTIYPPISSGSGSPGSTPTKIGAIYIDTTNKIAYVAKDTGSSADWVHMAARVMTTSERDSVSSPVTATRIWNTDMAVREAYDSQRWRGLSIIGWQPNAFPLNYQANAAFTTALTLSATNDAIAIPMRVHAPMSFESVSVRNTDTASARSWSWTLYKQTFNDGNASENILSRFASSNGVESFTASAASTRTLSIEPAHGGAAYLSQALYWLVIANAHATNSFGVGSTAASGAFAPNSAQTGNAGETPPPSILDMITGWSKVTAIYAACLNGRVFGQSSIF